MNMPIWVRDFYDKYGILPIAGGCGGGGDDNPPPPPTFIESPENAELKKLLTGKTSTLANLTYDDFLRRTAPSSEVSGYLKDPLKKYQDLINTQDYSLADYSKTEKDYLDTITGQYERTREKGFKPIQESLIAENLFGSGPGYGIMGEYGKETAQGVSDIAHTWAYEGLQRKQQAMQYKDALKRGDYTTMYNLALFEANREAGLSSEASRLEMASAGPALSLFDAIQSGDMAKYNAALQQYQAELEANQEDEGDFGGLGAGLGMLAGGLLAIPTGGMSIPMGALIGGSVGGGAGSMFKY